MTLTIKNEGRKAFALSWDLKGDSLLNNEDFLELLIDVLLDEECFHIKSYTESCIIFVCIESKDFIYWNNIFNALLDDFVWSDFVEIAKKNNGDFAIRKTINIEHTAPFNQKVEYRRLHRNDE